MCLRRSNLSSKETAGYPWQLALYLWEARKDRMTSFSELLLYGRDIMQFIFRFCIGHVFVSRGSWRASKYILQPLCDPDGKFINVCNEPNWIIILVSGSSDCTSFRGTEKVKYISELDKVTGWLSICILPKCIRFLWLPTFVISYNKSMIGLFSFCFLRCCLSPDFSLSWPLFLSRTTFQRFSLTTSYDGLCPITIRKVTFQPARLFHAWKILQIFEGAPIMMVRTYLERRRWENTRETIESCNCLLRAKKAVWRGRCRSFSNTSMQCFRISSEQKNSDLEFPGINPEVMKFLGAPGSCMHPVLYRNMSFVNYKGSSWWIRKNNFWALKVFGISVLTWLQ